MEYIRTSLVKRADINPEFYKNKKQRRAILADLNSKMAFLDCKGNIYTVGEFITDNDIMYSNSSYKERTFSFNFFDDYTIIEGTKFTDFFLHFLPYTVRRYAIQFLFF